MNDSCLGAPASLLASLGGSSGSPPARMPALPVVTRRHFFKTTLAASATLAFGEVLPTAGGTMRRDARVDTNITLGRWPFRRLPLDDTPALVAKLQKSGVTQAWAGSFDALFHRDIAAVNARLVGECRKHGLGLLLPFGSVNPSLPDWEEELRRCHGQHKMSGIRLHPNYHGYKLDEPAFAKLLALAGERGLIVQIVVSMEDERMQSALARVPDVDLAPLSALVATPSAPRVVLLNWFRAPKGDMLKKLAETARISFDIAMVEGVGGVANLMKQVPLESLLFGSHAPFFYFESALLKLKESALNDEQMRMICADNARRVHRRS